MRKRKLGIKGTINVFVALMMIPTIAFTGIMVDFARMNMASVMVNNAVDLAATSAIAYYDGLLHDVYGLYATSQDKEAIKEFCTEYVMAALNLDKQGSQSVKSFNLFSSGKSKNPVTVTTAEEPAKYSLKNTAYFKYEVEQYMKYRVAYSFMDLVDTNTDMITGLEDVAKDKETADNEREFVENDYREICEDIGKIQDKYQQLNDDIDDAEALYTSFNISTQQALDDINALYDDLEDAINNGETDRIDDIYDDIKEKAGDAQEDIEAYRALLADIKAQGADIDSDTNALRSKVAAAQQKLKDGSGTTYSAMFVGSEPTEPPNPQEALLAQLERELNDNLVLDLGSASNQFYNNNIGQFDNITYGDFTLRASSGGTVDNDVYTNADKNGGYVNPGDGYTVLQPPTVAPVQVNITPFDTSKKNKLEEVINNKPTPYDQTDVENQTADFQSDGDKLSSIQSQVPSGAPDLSKLSVPGGYSSASGSAINEGGADNWLQDLSINRILLTEYGVQMFTNYTTNRRWKDGKRQENEQTLSGIPLSPAMNYMYGAELEYIFWGNDSATVNYAMVITTLSAIFFARNLLFTFQDSVIKGEIAAIRAIPFAGWALAEAYRYAIVAAETVLDILTLIDGKCVPLVKVGMSGSGKPSWRSSITYTATYLLGGSAWGVIGQHNEGPGMYYHEYLRLLILLNITAGADKIAGRLATLVELNMNNYLYKNGGSAKAKLTTFDKFKLSKATVLAEVKATGSVPYFFLPMNVLTEMNSRLGREYKFEIAKVRGY